MYFPVVKRKLKLGGKNKTGGKNEVTPESSRAVGEDKQRNLESPRKKCGRTNIGGTNIILPL